MIWVWQNIGKRWAKSAVKRLVGGLWRISSHTGGYCHARLRLSLDLVISLACQLGVLIDKDVLPLWQWKGRDIKIVDGTTVTMPDTVDKQAAFPQQGSQKPGLGFLICRLVGVTRLSSGALLNAAIGRWNYFI